VLGIVKEPSTIDKSLIVTGLITLLSSGLSIWIAGKLSPQGELPLSKQLLWEIGSGAGMVFLGLISYTLILWKRDQKRERIRFAREMGRHICPCTETGEIMLQTEHEQAASTFVCPKCKAKIYDFDHTNTVFTPPKS